MLFGALLWAPGCTSFNHDWAKTSNQTFTTNGFLGRGGGTWRSEANGHSGDLRCLVWQKKDGSYEARFHAIYEKVLSYGYTARLTVTRTNDTFQFGGSANLGWWAGGIYQYEGNAQGTNFFSTYRCKYDHGTFQMTRPPHGRIN